jgi:hypothetical protein
LQGEREINQGDIILIALLPPHQQAAVAVKPTVQPLDDPPLRLVRALARKGRRAARRDVRRVAAPSQPLAHVLVVVALVATQVLSRPLAHLGALDRDGVHGLQRRLLIVAVGPGHHQPQRRASLVTDDMALAPQFGPIRRVLVGFRAAQWGLRRGTIQRLPEPQDAPLVVILAEQQAPQPGEDASAPPLLKAAMQGRTRPELLGRVLPLRAGAQHVEDAVEDGAVGEGGAARRARLLLLAQERLDLLPQRVGDVPYCLQGAFASHRFVPSKQNIQVRITHSLVLG